MITSSYKPTLTQELIWLDQKISGNNQKYNVGGYVRLTGDVNKDLLRASIMEVLARHDIFRSHFSNENGSDLIAHLNKQVLVSIIGERSFVGEIDASKAAIDWMKQDFQQPLILSDNELCSQLILQINDTECFWYCKLHHIICDGWSFQLLLNQVSSCYDQKINELRPIDLPPKYGSFVEYSGEDQTYLNSATFESDAEYWANDFKEITAPLFPKHGLLVAPSKDGGSYTLAISAEEKASLEVLAEKQKVTLFQVMVGVFLIYLARTCARSEVTIALPILNRTNRKFRETIGPFMNLLPVKFQYQEDWSFIEVIRQVRHKLFSIMRHQRYQYGYLLNDLNPDRPDDIYHVRLSYESFRFSSTMGNASCSAHALANHQEVDPLAIYIRDYNEDGFEIKFVYRRNYLIDESIASMSKGVKRVLDAAVVDINRNSGLINLMDEETIRNIHEFSNGPMISWRALSFSELWIENIGVYRDRVAIISANDRWTYGELDDEVKKYCKFLGEHDGIQRERIIALLLPTSEKVIFAMIASLMMGVAYIPLEPENPIERNLAFLRQIGCSHLLTTRSVFKSNDEINASFIEDLDEWVNDDSWTYNVTDPNHLAYIMQTSGSTGNPKGVPITNASVANYIQYFQKYFELTEEDTVVQASSLGFDTSVEEIYPILISGGKLQLLQNRRDLNELSNRLQEGKVTVLSASPLVLDYLNQLNKNYSSLRTIISGGDRLQYEHIDKFLSSGIEVFNTYGPTEATVCATYERVSKELERSIAIGTPIANAAVYLLNKKQELTPSGVVGEIYIGGAGIFSGYFNNEELNRRKFITHPFDTNQRLYRSGDTGIRLVSGSVAFLGRNDNEIKIRGMRIDPDEIEAAVRRHTAVDHAVAVPDRKLTEILCFYTTSSDSDKDITSNIRQFITRVLPPYMVPRKLIKLEKMVLNERGKVDRHKLLDHYSTYAERKLTIPRTRHEKKLIELWELELNHSVISTDASFFEIGGHSISANKMINRVNRAFMIELDLVDAFTYPTIIMLAAHIDSLERKKYDIIELC